MNVKDQVNETVNNVKSVISSTDDLCVISSSLVKLRVLLVDNSKTDANDAQTFFMQHHFVRFIYFLLDRLNSNWDGASREERQVFDDFFLKGNLMDSLIVLNKVIADTKPSYKLTKCVNLMEELVNTKNLSTLFICQCKIYKNVNLEIKQSTIENVITILVSLPERMANKLQKNNRSCFHPTKYFTNISSTIIVTLKAVNDLIQREQDCSLQFMSQLFGRCCLVGHADIVLANLIRRTVRDDSFIWRRICQKFVLGIPDRCMESMLASLVRLVPNTRLMINILGDAVVQNSKIHFIMTQKFLLIRVFNDDRILRNLLGYLSEIDPNQEILINVFLSLITIWSDKIAITHSSYEQHSYITRALLVCSGLLRRDRLTSHKAELLSKFMAGVMCHMQSPHEQIRIIGQITAECLAQFIDSDASELKFEYKPTAEIERLKSLTKPLDQKQEISNLYLDDIINQFEKIETQVSTEKSSLEKEKKVNEVENDNLDSDDDLEPYDMSNDSPVTKVKKPSYLRDCLEGLIDQSDPNRTETCLESAENLIRLENDLDPVLAIEFAKVAICLENSSAMSSFFSVRQKTLVALTVRCPAQMADYLTSQFYEPNYSIRQRLDILEILTSAAFELSQPKSSPNDGKKVESSSNTKRDEVENWKTIVEKRIAKKTKHFTKPQSTPKPTPNRFAPVAGNFFFSLMARFGMKNTFDLLGEDSLVLGKLLHTLGSIMYCAMHAPIALQMGKCLFDFLWPLRYHTEPYIRKGVLFCVCMIVLSLPPQLLQMDLENDFLECLLWLQDVISEDVNQECKHLAVQTLMLCKNVFSSSVSN